jgi:hypothetical protein
MVKLAKFVSITLVPGYSICGKIVQILSINMHIYTYVYIPSLSSL